MQIIKKRRLNPDTVEYIPTALKIAYFGKGYHGLQMQGTIQKEDILEPMLKPPSIESEIVKALLHLDFIHPLRWRDNFSKCGRTDKGVSSFCNVLVLNIRKVANPIIAINTKLPGDIRVIGFSRVDPDFSARFNCLSRTYRYYFVRTPGMCVNRMRRSAEILVGEHDFRNFCKIDPNLTAFIRQIHEVSFSKFATFNDEEIWVAEIKGSSFMWHQIRYTMAVLFLVGRGYEDEDISWMLNPNEVKPIFDMASELGLVLWDTEFDLKWTYDNQINVQECKLESTIVPDTPAEVPFKRCKPGTHDLVQFSKHQLLIELSLKEAFIHKYSLFTNRSSWGATGGLQGQSGHLTGVNNGKVKHLPSTNYKTLRERQRE